MSAPALMTFDQVAFGYNRASGPVLDNLNLSLKKGGVTAVLGPNGAGKTTLLLLALGWLKPWKGTIQLDGKRIQQISRRHLGQQIALIPQSEHIPFEYSVLEYVLLGRTPYLPPLGLPGEEDYEVAYEALERVGIAHISRQSMLALSGGEKQLVLAARALAQKPKLLLLDEPTSHLDLSNKVHLVELLQRLKLSGVTVLMTTHEPEIALAVSDQLVLMQKGRVVLTGETEAVATDQNLSQIYGVPIRVTSSEGRKQINWL